MASDAQDYARLAASDCPGLATLRAGLRERMAASALCDAERFTDPWLAPVQA